MDPANENARVVSSGARNFFSCQRKNSSSSALDQVFAVRANVDEFKEILAAEAVIRDLNADAASKRCAFAVLGEYERKKQFAWQPSRRAFKSLAHAAGLRNKQITRAWQKYQRDGKFAAIIAMLSDEERKAARERLIAANERAASVDDTRKNEAGVAKFGAHEAPVASNNEIIPLKKQLRNVAKKGWRPPTEKQSPVAKPVGKEQTLPHSIEAEQGVISSMMQVRGGLEAAMQIIAQISPYYFYNPAYRTIFTAISDHFDSGKPLQHDALTITLRERNLLQQVGDVGTLAQLQTFVAAPENFQYYLDILRDKHLLREAIRAGNIMLLRAQQPGIDREGGATALLDELESRITSIRSLGRDGADEKTRALIDYVEMDSKIIRLANLLGMRWLCRKGIALLVGATGVGKSSASIQAMILWALEREAFGIKPARALKFLYIQAENDDGDMQELVSGVCDHFKFSDDEREIIKRNVIVINERSLSGKKFLARLRTLVRKHKPHVVWIDPLQAYAGGDVKDSAVTTVFLRNGLNPILDEADCAAIISHHSTKTINLDTSEWTRTDWNYFGAGGAEIANVARAVLNITHTKTPGVFTWHGGKRWDRIGWADEDGNATDEHVYCWHRLGAIHWRDADDSDLARMRSGERAAHGGKTEDDFFNLVPQTGTIRKDLLFARRRDAGLSRDAARDFYKTLIEDKRIFEWEIPRLNARARPEIHVSRKPQPEPELIK